MRLKTFSAPTMAQAMDLVRAELGEEAIIVSTQKGPGGKGFRITAAQEMREAEDIITEIIARQDRTGIIEPIRDILEAHGTPPRLQERLLNAARALEATDAVMALAGALDAGFGFSPLPESNALRPLMLIGPPGAGKTVTVAKLAARAAIAGLPVQVITTDALRAGAVEQLAAFTRILKIELIPARTAAALGKALAARPKGGLCFIDSAGVNPFAEEEIAALGEFIVAGNVEPVVVIGAGHDPIEASDQIEALAALGPSRLLATRVDMTRRLGSLLAAADSGRLKFSNVSFSPHVANGLGVLNPVSLARLFMPSEENAGHHFTLHEAMS